MSLETARNVPKSPENQVIEENRQVYEFDEFRLDAAKRQLLRAGEVVPLYSKAFDLLMLLVHSSGRDLSKDEILESIWPGQILEESNLTVNISAVRKALGETASQPRFLVTIPGRGYRFVANVREQAGGEEAALLIQSETISQITIEEEAEDAGPESPYATENLLLPKPAKPLWRRPSTLAVVSLIAVALVAGGVLLLRREQQARAAGRRFRQPRLTQLTNDGRVVNAAISPDGKFFVFAAADRDLMSLRLGSINGEAPIELRPPANVGYRGITFAADGGSIYYTAAEGNQNKVALYRLPLLGRIPVKLRDDFVSYFAVSPDNKSIAIVKGNDATRTASLVLSNLDGTNERELVHLPYGRGLFGRNISWSPDGSLLGMGLSTDESGTQGAIYILPAEGGELRALTTPHWRDIERTAWLKDNGGLVMIGASQDTQEGRQVWLIDYPSGDFRRITNDLNSYDVGLSVTSDSNNVLLVQHQQITNVWVAPAEDFSKQKQITFGAINRNDGGLGIDWAAQNKIVYTSRIANSTTIWIMDADGANARALTPPGRSDNTPSVTGDGRFIVFQSNRSGGDEIWRTDIDGANPKQLTACGKNIQPNASPDGKWVVYRSGCDADGALWRVSIEGGAPTRITEQAGSWPWVSPDSKWVACEYAAAGKTQLAVIPIEGGPPAKVFEIPPLANFRFGIRWSPDGKSVTYRDWGKGLWRQPLEGGTAQRLQGLPDEKLYSYGWSRDGKLFAFTRGVEIRDVVLISNSN